MRLTIAAIGRLKDGGERTLVDRYVQRLKGARSVHIGPLDIVELPEARHATSAERQADEASRLLKRSADADLLVALDERGKGLSSQAFADWLRARRDDGSRHAIFVLGGPDGHGPALLQAAALKLSLGPMTLPHGLARVILAEQLYRAVTIMTGHPYHRE